MRLPHVTPFASTPIYFLTACAAGRRSVLANRTALDCLTEIWRKSALFDGWLVGRFVLMPDHVHVFASPAVEAKDRQAWLKVWKSLSARRLMKEFGVAAPFWQSDTFDHILRSAESYTQKWDYVRNNPVRAGHVIRPEDWPWSGEIHSLAF
jgi:REP element-mobilizing transposase RayT